MGVQKLEAIVLRSHVLGDTSRIVHVLAAEAGYLKLVAKGVRRQASRFGSALEPFNRVALVVYLKPHRDLQLVTGADLMTARRRLSGSLVRFAYASAVVELLQQLVVLGEGAHLVPLLDRTLAALETADGAVLRATFMAFALQALDASGFRPELELCVGCKGPVADPAAFNPRQGGVECESCRGAQPPLFLTRAARTTMQSLVRDLPEEAPPQATGDDIARALDAFMREHVHRYRRLRSLAWVRAGGSD